RHTPKIKDWSGRTPAIRCRTRAGWRAVRPLEATSTRGGGVHALGQSVPQPGVEPGPPPSQSGVISVSPPGQRLQRKERESNPQGVVASSRFERGAITSWLALP